MKEIILYINLIYLTPKYKNVKLDVNLKNTTCFPNKKFPTALSDH